MDTAKAVSRLVYTYTNPLKAGLEETIAKYPNASSWSAFFAGGYVETFK